MKRFVLGMAAVLGAAAFAPQPVAASCAQDYAQCLNDSWNLKGMLQVLADVECGAEYAGCIRRTVLGL